jgi:hypothetical protein
MPKPRKPPAVGVPRYQLKITLAGSKRPIWRRVIVRADIPLGRLHHVIQIAMGWTDSHMHQFIAGGQYYGQPGLDSAGSNWGTLDERRCALNSVAPGPKASIVYEYDLGDSWGHAIVVEKELPPDPSFKHPLCTAGARACPPEDCGGIPGYEHLLEALADKKHPEHADLTDWLGEPWDAMLFELDSVNARLRRHKA